MDTTAVIAAVFGGLIGAHLVQFARCQDRRRRLLHLAVAMIMLGVLTDQVTSGGGHSRTSHNIVFAVVIPLMAIAAIWGILGLRAGRRRAETPPVVR